VRLSTFLILCIALAFVVAGCISPWLRSAKIAMNEKDWDRALTSLEQELSRNPGSANALYLKGVCFAEMKDWKQMSDFFDQALEADTADTYTDRISKRRKRNLYRFMNRGINELDSAKWDSVVTDFGHDPGYLAQLDYARHETALAYFDTALVIDPYSMDLRRNAVYLSYEAEMFDRAMKYGTKAVVDERDQDTTLAIREVMMLTYKELENYDEMLMLAKEITRVFEKGKNSRDDGAYLRAFQTILDEYQRIENDEAAVKAANEALKRFPENNDIRKYYAYLLVKLEKFDDAEKVYLEVLAQLPDDFEANLYIGTVLVNKNVPENSDAENKEFLLKAIPYLEKAVEMQPESIPALRNLMAAYYNSGQDAKGIKIVDKIKALGSE